MGVRECWFCAGPDRAGDHLRVNLTRDVKDTFVGIGIYTRAKVTWVDVPRCRRCRVGHGIERVVRYVLVVSAASTGLMLLAWAASAPWRDQWQLALPVLWTLGWLVGWWGVREHWFRWRWMAPRPQQYAREHPAVQELTEDGWA